MMTPELLHREFDREPAQLGAKKVRQRAFADMVCARLQDGRGPWHIADIERSTDLSKDTVRKTLLALKRLGLITRHGRWHWKWDLEGF